jgi:hypothetical protein
MPTTPGRAEHEAPDRSPRSRRELLARAGRASLADLIAWMNAQPRKPGEEPHTYRHREVRQLLEELLDVRLYQRDTGCMLYFHTADLERQAPTLARAFLAPAP